jgi:hypothetical protein
MRSTSGELRVVTIWIEFNGTVSRVQYTFCVISIGALPLIVAAAAHWASRRGFTRQRTPNSASFRLAPSLL